LGGTKGGAAADGLHALRIVLRACRPDEREKISAEALTAQRALLIVLYYYN
jgi:hypothetical protein